MHHSADRVGETAMRLFVWLLFLGAMVASGATAAQTGLVCTTPMGWCALSEGHSTTGTCWCDSGLGRFDGEVGFDENPSPLLELKVGGFEPGKDRGLGFGPGTAASRGFAGPTQLPPSDFAAYGIVAFKRRVSSFDRERHMMICEAYINSLPHASELDRPTEEQMITIWPIATDEVANQINALGLASTCEEAVDNYGLVQAQNAISIVERYAASEGDYDLASRGPFLIAWTPTSKILQEGSAALVVDLSSVRTYDEAVEWMDRWRERIQDNPEMWRRGVAEASKWEMIMGVVRTFFDENGALMRFGG
jgi:hypothetical protein